MATSIWDRYKGLYEDHPNRFNGSSQSLNGRRGSYLGNFNSVNNERLNPSQRQGSGGRPPAFTSEARAIQTPTAEAAAQYGPPTPVTPPQVITPTEGNFTQPTQRKDHPNAYSGSYGPPAPTERTNRRSPGPAQPLPGQTDTVTPTVPPNTGGPPAPTTATGGQWQIPEGPLYEGLTPDMSDHDKIQMIRQNFLRIWTGG